MFDRDQAAGLRTLFSPSRPEVILALGGSAQQAQVVAGLGTGIASQGRDVLVIDGSAGEVAKAMGLAARYELRHVVDGDKNLSEVLLKGGAGLRILPAMRGLDRLWRLDPEGARRVRAQFSRHLASVETLIVNCGPLGSLAANRAFQGGAHVVIVLSEHTDAITAAYRELKTLRLDCGIDQCDVILSESSSKARLAFISLAETARRFLGVTLNLQGNLNPRRFTAEGASVRPAMPADEHTPWSVEPTAWGTVDTGSSHIPFTSSRSGERESGHIRFNQENAHAAVR
ncbi:MAG: hypothetical protein ABSF50_16220 [Burkholderiaceae bacterium]